MTLRAVFVAVLALLTALSAVPSGGQTPPDVTAARVEGPDRVATAAAVARLAYPDGTQTALIARAGDFPDALAGAPLAGVASAPVLLTGSDELPATTAQALADLGVAEVVLLGGTAAISQEVADTLAQDYQVRRLAGANRYETAAAVARRVAELDDIGATPGGMRSVFLAAGTTFPDALSAGAPAALGPNRFPILLTRPGELPAATEAALDALPVEQVLVVGGDAVVSPSVVQTLEDRGLNVVRFAGPTRTVTATEVADFAVDILGATPQVVTLARGDVFADALPAGPLAADFNGPLLLTANAHELGDPAAQWLAARCPDVSVVRAVGGAAAIRPAVLQEAEQAAESCTGDGGGQAPRVRLGFLSRTGDPLALLLTDLAASEPSELFADVSPVGGYDFSPDGSRVVYTRATEGEPGASQLVVAALDGSSARAVTPAGGTDVYPAFSPDGSEIAFVRDPEGDETGPGVYLVDAAAAAPPRLVVGDAAVQPLFPRWSPDGQRLAYQLLAEGSAPHVAVVDAAAASEPNVITEGRLVSATQPAWSPGGDLIALVGREDGLPSPDAHLYVIAPDGTGLRQLTESTVEGLDPAWSPDGQELAFAIRDGEVATSDLAVVSRDGSGERVLADVRTLDGSPTWSPDGGTIAFVAAFTEGASDIYAVLADGTGLRPLTSSGAADMPSFVPSPSG